MWALVLAAAAVAAGAHAAGRLRPPATPIVVHEPFVSVWSPSDNLTDTMPSFWAGQTIGMVGMLRVDGSSYRWMGLDTFSSAAAPVPAAAQQGLPEVGPTQTRYAFLAGGVELNVTWTTPAMGGAAWTEWIMRPFSYLSLSAASADGRTHAVQLYFETTGELTVNDVATPITWSRDEPYRVPGVTLLRVGAAAQAPLGAAGDDRRISWGFEYVAVSAPAPASGVTLATTMTRWADASLAFVRGGAAALPPDDPTIPRPCQQDWLVLAAACRGPTLLPGGSGSAGKEVFVVLTYDAGLSISYFGAPLAPAWAAK
jgi:hypothetical protein